jgi:hypothetical protein
MTPNFRQRFQAVTQEYRRQRNDLLGRERTLKQQSRAAIQAGGGGEPPLAIVRRHIALAHEEATLFEQETETLLEFMEPADVLRIFQRREAMTERIRQLQAGGESDVLDLTARPVGGGRR